MTISATVAIADMDTANAELEELGHGPDNFSVPIYNGGSRPSHATLHAWDDAVFLASLTADARVTVDTSDAGTPRARVQAHIAAQGLQWPDNAPEIPDSGAVSAGEYYRYGEDQMWLVIQSFDRSTFGAPPETYPALFRRARRPGQVTEWVQPIDQFDAYLTADPFTGHPERVTHNGATWECTSGSAGGPGGALLNTWEPGVFGWTEVAV